MNENLLSGDDEPKKHFSLHIVLPCFALSYMLGIIAICASETDLIHLIPLIFGFLATLACWVFVAFWSETFIRRYYAVIEFLSTSINWGLWFPTIYAKSSAFSPFYVIPAISFVTSFALAFPKSDYSAWICYSVLFFLLKLPLIIYDSYPIATTTFDILILSANILTVLVVTYILICNFRRQLL